VAREGVSNSVRSEAVQTRPSVLGRWLAGRMRSAVGNVPIRFLLWDGTETSAPGCVPAGILLVNASFTRRILLDRWFLRAGRSPQT